MMQLQMLDCCKCKAYTVSCCCRTIIVRMVYRTVPKTFKMAADLCRKKSHLSLFVEIRISSRSRCTVCIAYPGCFLFLRIICLLGNIHFNRHPHFGSCHSKCRLDSAVEHHACHMHDAVLQNGVMTCSMWYCTKLLLSGLVEFIFSQKC